MAALAILVDSTLGASGAIAGGYGFAVTLGLRIELGPLARSGEATLAESDVVHADRAGSLTTAALRSASGAAAGHASLRALAVDANATAPRSERANRSTKTSNPGTVGDPIDRLLGATSIQAADGTARLTFDTRPELTNGGGRLHGGVVAGIAQRAAHFAVASSTVDVGSIEHLVLDVDFFRPVAPSTRLEVHAAVRTRTRRYAWAESEVRLPGDTIAARARVVAAITPSVEKKQA